MYASRSGSILTHSGRFMSWKGEFNCPISFQEKNFNVLTNLWMINMFVLFFPFWTSFVAHTCAHAHLSLHCWMFCQGNVMCVWCGFVSFSVLRSLILNIHQIYVFSYIINVLNKRVSDQSHSDLSFFLLNCTLLFHSREAKYNPALRSVWRKAHKNFSEDWMQIPCIQLTFSFRE